MFTCKFAQHFESSLERVDKRVTKRWNGMLSLHFNPLNSFQVINSTLL